MEPTRHEDGVFASSRFRVYGFLLIALALLARLLVAWSRYLQVDELQILHLAWLRAAGDEPGVDYAFPQFSVLIDFLELMWRSIGVNLEGIFVARAFQWGMSTGITLLTGVFAARLAGWSAGVGAMIGLSFMTEFTDRSLEVRSDPFLALLMLAAFLVIQSADRRWFVAGALSAAAVLFNFKALLLIPFIGLAGIIEDIRDRKLPVNVLRFGGSCAAVLAGYACYLVLREDFALYVETITRNLTVSAATESRIEPWRYFSLSLHRNAPFYVLSILGIVLLLRKKHGSHARKLIAPILFTVVYVFANPTFFPYNFVDVAPVWAIPVGISLQYLFVRSRLMGWVVIAALVTFPFVRIAHLLSTPTLPAQLRANRMIMDFVPPDERIYDSSGLILFRRGPFHWRLHSLMLPRYRDGEFHLYEQLWRYRVRVVIPSYRFTWLVPSDREFLNRAYPLIHGKIGVAGWTIGPADWTDGRASMLITSDGWYRIYAAERPTLEIDGVALRSRLVWLKRGKHEVSSRAETPKSSILLLWSGAPLEQLEGFPDDSELYYFWGF